MAEPLSIGSLSSRCIRYVKLKSLALFAYQTTNELTIFFFSIQLLQLELFDSHQTDALSNIIPLALALSAMIKTNDSNSQPQRSGEEESGPFSDVLLLPGNTTGAGTSTKNNNLRDRARIRAKTIF